MKLRRPPKNIPLYSSETAMRKAKESTYDNVVTEFIATICMTIALVPVITYYFVKNSVMQWYDVVRYCTYSLTDDEEQMVQRHIERIGKPWQD